MDAITTLLTTIFWPTAGLLLGLQIQHSELRLLTGRYNYKPQAPQVITYISTLLALVGTAYFILTAYSTMTYNTMLYVVLPFVIFIICEWLLTYLNPATATSAWGFRLLLCLLMQISPIASPLPFITYTLCGLFLRNSPFGIPFGKDLCIACHMTRKTTTDFAEMNYTESTDSPLPETSYAGSRRNRDESTMKRYDVSEYGVTPNSRTDCSEALQALINQVGEAGGGIIFFPRGRYNLNTSGEDFLQINHSNVILEGEVDAEGRPLTTLINCCHTSRGHKNPWISPFFITTGESLQPSNEFWGLQFRKRQETVLRSNSLSDPGSDGTILSPDITTYITANATKGSTRLTVENARAIGKYILIGLYNTTSEASLLKDILGTDQLRPEWTVANRAGEEEAPSYQWLIEVKRIIDDTTIELVRPLLRNIDTQYAPVICNVDMLEGIVIRNLRLESRWNGQFRHHGFPLYYNIPRTQEMDYGWNAINMKRCAHSEVTNVIIRNFSNPLYVLDSRSVTISHINIDGYDGHQALKAYMHTCDCLFEDVTFHAHFADMMGCEGPAYANVFRRISYLNPVFKPVDYDFHGFASEPMSPPSDNMFTQILGFRYFKSAGSITHMPSLARHNTWWNIKTEGEREGDQLFYVIPYREKKGFLRWIFAIGYATAMIQKTKRLSPSLFCANVRQKLQIIDKMGFPRSEHRRLFFIDCHVSGIHTKGVLALLAMLCLGLTADAQNLLWDVTNIDAKGVVQSSDRFCQMPPVAVTDKPTSRSGNKHNFEALSIYTWPDPNNPDGPYIVRDGQPNPEYKEYDLPRLEELVKRTGALSRAFYVTGDEKYYDAFCHQIDAWFITRKTKMKPNFEYNQFIPGRNNGKGNSAGLIDAYNFINVLEAVRLVESKRSLGNSRTKKLKKWFKSFAHWMQTSEMGMQEARATNNHGTAYDITLYVIGKYIGDDAACQSILDQFAERRINPQIQPDGSQPEELKRTKAFNYSVYNLQHLVDFCIIQRNLGNDYLNGDGRRIKTAIEYLDQFVGHRDLFPYQEIGNWEEQERNVRTLKAKISK